MMVLINSCMITHYIVEENIFAVTVYKILEEQKHWNEILKITLRLMVSKWLRYLRKVNTLDLKIMKKITIYDLHKFEEIILVPEDHGKQNQINIENILLVVMAIN